MPELYKNALMALMFGLVFSQDALPQDDSLKIIDKLDNKYGQCPIPRICSYNGPGYDKPSLLSDIYSSFTEVS